LAAKYGKNFAEDLARRYLEEEEAERLLAIENEEERRHQIALAIKRRIENGEIHVSELDEEPRVEEWLKLNKEKADVLKSQAREAIADVKAGEEIEVSEKVAYKAKDLVKEDGLASTFLEASTNSVRESNSKDSSLGELFATSDSSQPKPSTKPFG
jgi:hypothetical protein